MAAEKPRRRLGQGGRIGVLRGGGDQIRQRSGARCLPDFPGRLQGAQRPLPGEEILPGGQDEQRPGRHARQKVDVIQPRQEAARPHHFVVRIHAVFQHGPRVRYIGAGRGAGKAFPGGQHEHARLGAAPAMARQGNAGGIDLRPGAQVIQPGETVPDEIPGQAEAQQLAFGVHQVVLAGAALDGLQG